MADTGDTGTWAAIGTAIGAALAALGYKRATARKDKPDMAMIEAILSAHRDRITTLEEQMRQAQRDREESRQTVLAIFSKLDRLEERTTEAITLLKERR